MKLTLHPTADIHLVDGIPCRVWEGYDQNGTEVRAHIRMVQPQTHDPARLADFDRQLRELPKPERSLVVLGYRFILDNDAKGMRVQKVR